MNLSMEKTVELKARTRRLHRTVLGIGLATLRRNASKVKTSALFTGFVISVAVTSCITPEQPLKNTDEKKHEMSEGFLPNVEASKVVSVATNAPASAVIVVQTQAVAVKETGPKETVSRFGEVYAFSPSFIAVHRDEPTLICFWNLQPDDEHAFMLINPRRNVLMKAILPPLKETSFVFTFHEEGPFDFVCAMHRPAMNGQILVLPPRVR